MKTLDLFSHRRFRREAQKIADRIAVAYPRNLALQPDAEERDVITSIFFDETGCRAAAEQSKDKIAVCCKTVNGLSYLLALKYSSLLVNATNVTILQFTKYLDNELESLGFPPQSPEQKEEILNALELDLTGRKDRDEPME